MDPEVQALLTVAVTAVLAALIEIAVALARQMGTSPSGGPER
jgi:hypothetical protein